MDLQAPTDHAPTPPARSRELAAKRMLDLFVSIAALVVLSPLILLTALLVRIALGSPVLFRQKRAGLRGKAFTILKFRTMSDARNASGILLPDADRLRGFGKLLRKTSLDELPQLINVVRGDMSLVGPRPLLLEYGERYSPEQARRLLAKPGITGWVQVNGRNDMEWEEKFSLDTWYVENWTCWLDVKILFHTVAIVLGARGTARQGHATMPEFNPSTAASPGQFYDPCGQSSPAPPPRD